MKQHYNLVSTVVALLIILVAGLLLAGCDTRKVNKFVTLNTTKMVEADDNIIDSTMGPALISAYLCKITNNLSEDSIPYADVYVCKSFKRDAILGDTVIILDTQLRKEISGNPNIYWTGIKKTKKLKACKIAVPQDQLSKLQKYTYKYARVTLVTDD
ncbi:hypothetical protein [Mucilaginibacter endophyticus]|uniref:hypothetical protein n=1 Tax=Mucilaginibacter endophyticus TaxID=2675003 RepID=UPI000E0D23DC|nr:hypothetical protein [Mucilaginibacter endophyticus]